MYDKETCRTSLNNLKKYVKLSQFADEFGINRFTLSLFMKDSAYDYQLSNERVYNFLIYVKCKLESIT